MGENQAEGLYTSRLLKSAKASSEGFKFWARFLGAMVYKRFGVYYIPHHTWFLWVRKRLLGLS